MAATTAPTKQILMSDMFTIDNNVDFRRFKVSARSSDFEDAYTNRSYVVSGEYTANDGTILAMNITDEIDYSITRVVVNGDYQVEVRGLHATGSQDGTFKSNNKNLISNLDGFGRGVIFYNAVANGDVLAAGVSEVTPNVVCDINSKPSIIVRNNSGAPQTIRITVDLLEFGERPEAETILYNGAQVTYLGEDLFHV